MPGLLLLAVFVAGCSFATFKDVVTGKGYVPRNRHGVPVQGEPEPKPVDIPEEDRSNKRVEDE